jgi:glutamate racemase
MHGIFDSGLGGLSVWRQYKKLHPNAPLLYFADQAHIPYGDLSLELSYNYVVFAIEKMISLGATSISIACHTISSTHGERLKKEFDFPIFDISSNTLLKTEKKNKIAVIGTRATIESNYYQHAFGSRLHSATSCPLLVPMIEGGKIEKKKIATSLSSIGEGAKSILLACTHYPFISDVIFELLEGIEIIDPAPFFAKSLPFSTLFDTDLFFTTGSPERFHQLSTTLLKTNLSFPFFIKPLECSINPTISV